MGNEHDDLRAVDRARKQAKGKVPPGDAGVLTLVALLGFVGTLVHSWLDFNLQIPANAALFYVLSAIAAGEPLQESQRRRHARRHHLILETKPELTEKE